MADLLLTLGHNASAIAISVGSDGVAMVENAYELERISGAKGDSRFPLDAIIRLKERGVEHFDRVYVTHWDPENRVDGMRDKYWDRSVFPTNVPVITQESLGLTHHDCHANAAVAFAGDDFPRHDSAVLVIDGFGSWGEHLSYYRFNPAGGLDLVRRVYGYSTSLGLMYQYATAFLGLKMHEDEFKLLGYDARVGDVDVSAETLALITFEMSKSLLRQMRSLDGGRLSVDLGTLPRVQEAWNARFARALDQLGMVGVDHASYDVRCVIGHIVQGTLLTVVRNLFASRELPEATNLIVTGGVAYNVDLNRILLNMTRGRFCAMPLAGDQGNSIGLWAFHNKKTRLDFGDLCWGKRQDAAEQVAALGLPDGLHVFERDGPEVLDLMRSALAETGFVNLVRGRMEFGPRALCNTSTIALADSTAVVDEINRINGRDTVMPFAPVVRADLMAKIFPASDRMHKSDRFMICATEYGDRFGPMFAGAALHNRDRWTGRPQSYEARYEGDSVAALLGEHGLLINTSFNVHGVPICCDIGEVIHSHQFQRERNPKVTTIVIAN